MNDTDSACQHYEGMAAALERSGVNPGIPADYRAMIALIRQAEAALSAALAELAGARNKALEEAATMVEGMYRGLAHNRLYRDITNEVSPRIRALKEAPHV